MSKRGTYLVEDLDGAYWESRGGGLGKAASFYERGKILIDEMNACYTGGALKPGPCGTDIFSISFYNAIVVIERTPYLNRYMLRRPVGLNAPAQR
jgi:hypothetical protein